MYGGWGHCGLPVTHFVYLFHMAIFFIASGYCYKASNSLDYQSTIHYIKRKFAFLWLPYVLWMAIYSILNNFFIRINVYTDNPLLMKYVSGDYIDTTRYWTVVDVLKNIIKAFLLHGYTQIGGALWFLATLFEISVGYSLISLILNLIFKKDEKKVFITQWIIAIVLLCLGFICYKTKNSFAGIDKVFSYYSLFHGGYSIKKHRRSCKERNTMYHIAIFAVSLTILIIMNDFGTIALNKNSYVNPIYFLIVSFTGWQFLYEIAYCLQKFIIPTKIFVCIGQNTLAVVILHFLCFKIVSYIGVLINHQPLFLVAAFPVLFGDDVWWMAYMTVGIAIPVCLSILWASVKKHWIHAPGIIGLS